MAAHDHLSLGGERLRRSCVLRREVGEAVGAGSFHVWAVSTVEEGIELLTGLPRELDERILDRTEDFAELARSLRDQPS